MSDNRRFVLPAEAAGCQLAVEAFHRFAAEKGLSERTVFDIHLVLDELLSNIANHGFEGRKRDEGRIELRMRLNGSLLEIRISDNGIPFNMLEKEQPSLQDSLQTRPVGGLGILLVKKKLDGIEYAREEDYNVLRLKKTVSFDRKCR